VTTAVQARFGVKSATGLAKETVFGTPVAATTFLPMTGNKLELDPGLFWPSIMQGVRDAQIYALQGQRKSAGSIDGPLFPTQAGLLIPAAIGGDGGATGSGPTASGGGAGVTGSTPTHSTTTVGAINAGDSNFTVTSPTGWAIGQICQVDVNGAGPPATTSEVRKVSNLVGSVVTVDAPFNFTHLTGAAAATVVAPFTHTIVQSDNIPSLTVEKNIGGTQSIQFAGAKVNKYSLSVQATNSEVSQTVDMMAKTATVLDPPTATSYVQEFPYVFAEGSLTLNSQLVAQAISVDLTIDNGLKDTYTLNGSHELQFLTPLALTVGGKADVVFHNLNDADWGYFNLMKNNTSLGAMVLTFVHPSNGGTITFNMPYVRINTLSDTITMKDIVTTTLNFNMGFDPVTAKTISATMVNATYLPY